MQTIFFPRTTHFLQALNCYYWLSERYGYGVHIHSFIEPLPGDWLIRWKIDRYVAERIFL